MKKFFGIGLLALLATAYLTSSCSRDDLSGSLLEAKAEAFSNAFKEVYGDPDPQHTWGFGASTRAFTRGSNDNKNQWGNPNHGNWQIPPALTAGQVLRVKTYFQQNPHLTFEAPNYSTYFVQQVYKGNTDANLDFSREVYKSANSSTYNVVGSNHMDKLTVGPNNIHVDNFNYGTYNGGDSLNVLNTGATDESNSANYHKDMITLIEDVRPTCVGFNESESSYQHNDHAALVSAATIDAWIEEKFGASFGAKCVDGWDRDFVGLDYEATPADGTYVRDANNEIIYATIGDYDMGKTYVWDGSHFYLMSEVRNNLLKTPQNVTFPVVSTDKNMYLGDYVKIDQNNLVTEFEAGVMMDDLKVDKIDGDASRTRKHQVLDLTKIFNLVGNGGCAAVNNDKGGFVKNFGGRDYYFSDWIVTLTKAKEIGDNSDDTPSEGTEDINVQRIIDGRIFCEDLGSADRTDIDFNDVVFDAFTYVTDTYEVPYTLNNGNKVYNWNNKLYKSTTYNKTDINLLAAGGTIDIQVAQQDVNTLLGIGKTTMANTYVEGASPDLSHTSTRDGVSPYKFTLNSESYTDLRNIPISVKQGNQVRELSANIGDVPQKFRAPVGTPWLVERRAIDYGFPRFRNWVESEQQTGEPWNFMTYDYLYHVKFISNNDVNQLGGTIADYGIDWERVAMKVNGETPITITLNETLQEGDQIAITGYRDQTDNATGTLYIKFNGSAVAQTQNFNNKAFNPNGIETKENTFVFTVTSATAGNDGFQLTKDTSGAEIYITSITVIGGLGAQRGETTSDDSTPVTPMDPEGQGEEEESDPTVTAPTNPTWSGTQAFTVDGQGRWSGQVQIDGNYNDFNNMGNGTYIRIYGYGTSNDWQVQLARQQVANPWTWTDMTNVYHQWGSTVNTSTTIEFGPLPADSARAVITDGKLVVLGKNFVVKYVKIDNSQVSSGSSVSGPFFSAIPTAAWSVPASTTNAQIGSSYATITGGKMYVTNGQTDARDLIKNQGGEWAFQHTHNNTFFKVELYNALQAGDVISVRMQSRTDTNLGLFFSTATSRPSSATAQIVLPQASAQAWTDGLTYTVAAGDGICGVKTFYIYRAEGKSTYFNSFAITRH